MTELFRLQATQLHIRHRLGQGLFCGCDVDLGIGLIPRSIAQVAIAFRCEILIRMLLFACAFSLLSCGRASLSLCLVLYFEFWCLGPFFLPDRDMTVG
jgi:hypothetical protein